MELPAASMAMNAFWPAGTHRFERVRRRRIPFAPAGLVGAVLLTALVAGSSPAGAAGGRLAPVQESYEPGDVATMVGYTGGPALAALPTAPVYAYLRSGSEGGDAEPLDTDVPLGRLVLEETSHRGFLALRVSITFEVPEDLDAGEYVVWFCDDPCTRTPVGDLVASPLAIGVEPARPVARAWAFDEPEIANLAPDALIVGPDFQATADDVRGGKVAPPPEPSLPMPPAPATAPAPAPSAPPPPPPEVAAAAEPEADTMDWPLPTALMVAAAMGTWLLLARRERACAPELARSPRGAPGAGRNAAAGGG